MFNAGPWRIYSFDETTHRPGRAVPIASTIKQPQITAITENTVTVRGPSAPSLPRRMPLSPDIQSINEQISACQNDVHREVGSV